MDGEYVYSVEKGEYKLKISGLKHFGNPNVETDWDTWISVVLDLTV